MGEEQKKPEEKKAEEAPKAEQEKPSDEKKAEEKAEEGDSKKESKDTPPPPPPAPPQEIVLQVYMHCEGCARKVRRCLKGFQGVEDVEADCKTHKVVVKGEKADPLKVLERVQRKSHRQVVLLSPIPKPSSAEEPDKPLDKDVVKVDEKKPEPQVITVVLSVHMHCEACAQEIRRRILKMKGVENVATDLKSSQVTAKGVFEPPQLVQFIYKRTGKKAVIVKVEPEKKAEEEKPKEGKEEKKAEEGGEKKAEESKKGEEDGKEKKEGEEQAPPPPPPPAAPQPAEVVPADDPKLELKKNEFYYYPPQYHHYYYPQRFIQQQEMYYPAPYYPPPPLQRFMQQQEMYNTTYAPQMFSDENPNACSVM